MSSFLIVFDRKAGQILKLEEHADRRAALRLRFEAETEYRGDPNIEVVVLVADSVDALKRTHGRYFGASLTDLYERVKQEFEDAAAERTRTAS